MKTGLVCDPIYLKHDTGTHVENSHRLEVIMSHLEKHGTLEELIPLPPRPATVEEVERIHSPEYIAHVQQEALSGGGWLDPDTVVSAASYEAALHAAGGSLTAVEAVMKGDVESAFALVRPPGHHATRHHSKGFCLFNNIAIATRFALDNYSNIDRILIADFDVHHGNGTQEAFYADPHVLYFSTHQSPYFPGTGAFDEIGEGAGKGTTINCPLPAGCGDEEHLKIFQGLLPPLAYRFQPQLMLVSAGFDGHWADDIAMMEMSTGGFAQIVLLLKRLAIELCQGRLVLILEGGYHLLATASSVKATFDTLLGKSEIDDPLGKSEREEMRGVKQYIDKLKKLHCLE